jgi:hypothetical protein
VSRYTNAVARLAADECTECGGIGECNDAELGDIYHRRWKCEKCGGSGFDGAHTTVRVVQAPGLDAITVIYTDYNHGRGRVILACWDRTWQAAFGAMPGKCTMAEFFNAASPGYMESKLDRPPLGRVAKKVVQGERDYLARIVAAVRSARLT